LFRSLEGVRPAVGGIERECELTVNVSSVGQLAGRDPKIGNSLRKVMQDQMRFAAKDANLTVLGG
jgi:hypothetical protein